MEHRWSATYLKNEAETDKTYHGAIDISKATSAFVEDNFIAGSERIGLNYRGASCSGALLNHSIERNTIYASGGGVVIQPRNAFNLGCIRISGFTVYKSHYYAIYYQGSGEILLDNNQLIDNQIGVFTIVVSPHVFSHENTAKKYRVKDTLIVGRSNESICEGLNDVHPNNLSDVYSLMSSFGSGEGNKGRIGLVWPNFLSGENGLPTKPWTGVTSYNQIGGQMIVSNVTLVNFGQSCGGRDYAFATNPKNDDGQHPIQVSGVSLVNVQNASKVFIHRPNIRKINPSDCVDMDCDGLKKNLLKDLDGSLLGGNGGSSVISQSEFGWGDQKRGLGDFRIPKEMLSYPNGSLMEMANVYKHPGVVRDEETCVYVPDWQAYKCQDVHYEMLIIESMDADTETRRLSPVAILSDNGYLDLINGPQDHGWCFGYTCQKRVSTFMALVAANKSYDIFLSSTPPDTLRLRIINSDPSFKIRLSMHYFTPQRIDLYKNSVYVLPTNGYIQNSQQMLKDMNNDLNQYMPHYQNISGTNLFYKPNQKIYFSIDGSGVIDLKIASVLFLTFEVPSITVEEFFKSDTIVANVALLLDVSPSMIRQVKVIKESKKKRLLTGESLNKIEFSLEDNPIGTITENVAFTEQKEKFSLLAVNISNSFATGQVRVKIFFFHGSILIIIFQILILIQNFISKYQNNYNLCS